VSRSAGAIREAVRVVAVGLLLDVQLCALDYRAAPRRRAGPGDEAGAGTLLLVLEPRFSGHAWQGRFYNLATAKRAAQSLKLPITKSPVTCRSRGARGHGRASGVVWLRLCRPWLSA
jgi:hypothetical protein